MPPKKDPLVCPHTGCGLTFTSSVRLANHRLTHEPPKVQCPACPKKYHTTGDMRRHLTKDHKKASTAPAAAQQPVTQSDPSQAHQSAPQPSSSSASYTAPRNAATSAPAGSSSSSSRNAVASASAALSSSSSRKGAIQTASPAISSAAPDVEMKDLLDGQQVAGAEPQRDAGSNISRAPRMQRKVTPCQSWRATGRYELWQCDELKCFEVYTLESVIKRHKKYRLSQHQPSQLVE